MQQNQRRSVDDSVDVFRRLLTDLSRSEANLSNVDVVAVNVVVDALWAVILMAQMKFSILVLILEEKLNVVFCGFCYN